MKLTMNKNHEIYYKSDDKSTIESALNTTINKFVLLNLR